MFCYSNEKFIGTIKKILHQSLPYDRSVLLVNQLQHLIAANSQALPSFKTSMIMQAFERPECLFFFNSKCSHTNVFDRYEMQNRIIFRLFKRRL